MGIPGGNRSRSPQPGRYRAVEAFRGRVLIRDTGQPAGIPENVLALRADLEAQSGALQNCSGPKTQEWSLAFRRPFSWPFRVMLPAGSRPFRPHHLIMSQQVRIDGDLKVSALLSLEIPRTISSKITVRPQSARRFRRSRLPAEARSKRDGSVQDLADPYGSHVDEPRERHPVCTPLCQCAPWVPADQLDSRNMPPRAVGRESILEE